MVINYELCTVTIFISDDTVRVFVLFIVSTNLFISEGSGECRRQGGGWERERLRRSVTKVKISSFFFKNKL